MPIYAYKCSSCGVAQDILRKISDPPLTTCPACGQETLAKQVTAAGFQLKGSGWYVTDFRGGDNKAGAQSAANQSAGGQASEQVSKPDTASPTADGASVAVPAAPAPAAAPVSTPTSGATAS